jgi:hypothetical protein
MVFTRDHSTVTAGRFARAPLRKQRHASDDGDAASMITYQPFAELGQQLTGGCSIRVVGAVKERDVHVRRWSAVS